MGTDGDGHVGYPAGNGECYRFWKLLHRIKYPVCRFKAFDKEREMSFEKNALNEKKGLFFQRYAR